MFIGKDYKGQRLIVITNRTIGNWLYRHRLADLCRIGQVAGYRIL